VPPPPSLIARLDIALYFRFVRDTVSALASRYNVRKAEWSFNMPTLKPAKGRKGRAKIRPVVLVACVCLAIPGLAAAFMAAEERHKCSTTQGNFEYARCIGAACKRRLGDIGREIVPAVLGGGERLDLTVSSAAELTRALARAGSGCVIRLGPRNLSRAGHPVVSQ